MEKTPQFLQKNEQVIEDEKLLEKETGITSSVLKKIRENPKLRKIFFSMILTIGLSGAIQSVEAQSGTPNNGDGSQNESNKNNLERLLKEVKSNDLKDYLEGYKPTAGGMTLKMILEHVKDYKFKIMNEPAVGETESATNNMASQTIKLSGILANQTSRIFTFSKKIKNGNVSILKVVAYK